MDVTPGSSSQRRGSSSSGDNWPSSEKYPHNPDGIYEVAAKEYLSKHKINEFFENLTAALVFEKPEDPKAFAKDFIKKLQEAQKDPEMAKPPSLIDTSNLESIFGMLDITKTGYISLPQYRQAMMSLGLKKFNGSPSGADFNKISLPTFIREAKSALGNATATFDSSSTD